MQKSVETGEQKAHKYCGHIACLFTIDSDVLVGLEGNEHKELRIFDALEERLIHAEYSPCGWTQDALIERFKNLMPLIEESRAGASAYLGDVWLGSTEV